MKQLSRAEITPEHIFLNRRRFMIGAGSAAGALALAACVTPGSHAGRNPRRQRHDRRARGRSQQRSARCAGL